MRTAYSPASGPSLCSALAATYDAYRMAAEALLGRQGLRATGGEGSHMTVEDAISAQFAKQIPGSRSRRSSGFGALVMLRSTSTPRARRSALTTLR